MHQMNFATNSRKNCQLCFLFDGLVDGNGYSIVFWVTRISHTVLQPAGPPRGPLEKPLTPSFIGAAFNCRPIAMWLPSSPIADRRQIVAAPANNATWSPLPHPSSGWILIPFQLSQRTLDSNFLFQKEPKWVKQGNGLRHDFLSPAWVQGVI